MLKLRKALGMSSRDGDLERTMPRKSTQGSSKRSQSKEQMPHYLTYSQRMAATQMAQIRQPTTSSPLYARDFAYPTQDAIAHPRTPSKLDGLTRLTTSTSTLSEENERSTPTSASTSISTCASKSIYSTPSTLNDECQEPSTPQTFVKSPIVDAMLNETYDRPDQSFDWDQCTFAEDEEEAMWLPEMPNLTAPASTRVRRRSASAPAPAGPTGRGLLDRRAGKASANVPSLTMENYSLTASSSCCPPRAPSPISPGTPLRSDLPEGHSDDYAAGQDRVRSHTRRLPPSPLSPMRNLCSPTSPLFRPESSRSVRFGQPSPALPSPSQCTGFRVLSRQPMSPASVRFDSYLDPPSPALSTGSDWQRSTNELRLAGAHAIRNGTLHRTVSTHALSTPPEVRRVKTSTSSSALGSLASASSSEVSLAQPKSRNRATTFTILAPRAHKRRNRPATTETALALESLPDELEFVDELETQVQIDAAGRLQQQPSFFGLKRSKARQGRPSTADAIPWKSSRENLLLA